MFFPGRVSNRRRSPTAVVECNALITPSLIETSTDSTDRVFRRFSFFFITHIHTHTLSFSRSSPFSRFSRSEIDALEDFHHRDRISLLPIRPRVSTLITDPGFLPKARGIIRPSPDESPARSSNEIDVFDVLGEASPSLIFSTSYSIIDLFETSPRKVAFKWRGKLKRSICPRARSVHLAGRQNTAGNFTLRYVPSSGPARLIFHDNSQRSRNKNRAIGMAFCKRRTSTDGERWEGWGGEGAGAHGGGFFATRERG